MLDIKFIREHSNIFDAMMQMRGEAIKSDAILELDALVRKDKTALQDLQNKKNQIAKHIGILKSQKQDVPSEIIQESNSIGDTMLNIEAKLINLESQLHSLLHSLPNLLDEDVPYGESEADNIVVKSEGTIRQFDFTPKQHFEIGEKIHQIDFESAAKISGSRFVVLKQDLALMERALINFMLDEHTQHFGYNELSVPYIVNEKTMFGTGQLPKFGDDSFKTTNGFRLIPTAEVPLTNMVADQILNEDTLPIRMTSHTPCFRSEAGSAGKDTRGMLRQHQFHKVELVSVVKADESAQELERMLSVAENILKRLELPYRVMLLCSKDTGFASKKTYDIEVWLPGQNCYREISSCSSCGDFQARRMKTRYRKADGNIEHVHTLNGSALAIGRTMVAIIENYQCENGEIDIPKALQSYMHNKKIIKKVD